MTRRTWPALLVIAVLVLVACTGGDAEVTEPTEDEQDPDAPSSPARKSAGGPSRR